jgi:hypothetical protein
MSITLINVNKKRFPAQHQSVEFEFPVPDEILVRSSKAEV